jgi:hypothetical protein
VKLANLPPFFGAGVLVGVAAGLAVGAMSNLLAALAGAVFGGAAGAIAGFVMDREGKRAARRTRQLDEIIGVTTGAMGAPPKSIRSGDLTRDPEAAFELESWAEQQWLTPPPPATR